MEPKRRLSAVWFADIVGYTTLSRIDEPAALRLVDVLQRLSREIVEGHDGRVVKLMGDAVLAEFGSTDSAVRAAVALQERYVAAAKDSGQASQLRIGVHLGEVTAAADGDLYGDGINTAARLHHEAVPGQVIISEDVWRLLRQRPEFRFASLGAVELKGITTRVEIYDVLFGARAALGASTASAITPPPDATARAATLRKAVIAVTAILIVGFLAVYAATSYFQKAATPEPSAAAPPVTSSAPNATSVPQQTAPAPSTVPASKPAARPQTQAQAPPPVAPSAAPASTPDAERARDRNAVRDLLEQFTAALNSANPTAQVAALGPGATMMSRRGVQEIRTQFGEGFNARLGRIEPVSTRPDAIELKFLLVARSNSRQQTPLGFHAVITRSGTDYRFTQLRRDVQPARGRGRAGR